MSMCKTILNESRLVKQFRRMQIYKRFPMREPDRDGRSYVMKERLDVLLVQQGLAPSREKAKALIMAGAVLVDGQREDKPGTSFQNTVKITVKGAAMPYVSRGGLKLEKAVKHFSLDLDGRICMDVGSSTGGFTDCMLQNGAAKVYSVDVGYGQLDWKLRNDPRVVCMEKTNIRYVTPADIDESPSFVSIDVAFISLTKVLGPVLELLEAGGEIVCLIKPQFEAGREKVGKKGVVRDPDVHREVIKAVTQFALSLGFDLLHLEFSPIKGPEGNIEYLLHLRKPSELLKTVPEKSEKNLPEKPAETSEGSEEIEKIWKQKIDTVVNEAHQTLDKK